MAGRTPPPRCSCALPDVGTLAGCPPTKARGQPPAAAVSCLTISELILVVGANPCARSKWRRARRVSASSTPLDLTAYPSLASAIWAARTRAIRRRACRARERRSGRARALRNVVRRWAPTIDAACRARPARLRMLCQAPTLGWRGIRLRRGRSGRGRAVLRGRCWGRIQGDGGDGSRRSGRVAEAGKGSLVTRARSGAGGRPSAAEPIGADSLRAPPRSRRCRLAWASPRLFASEVAPTRGLPAPVRM